MKSYSLYLSALLIIFLMKSVTVLSNNDLVTYIESRALPLDKSADLDELVSVAGDRKLVLMGEASHGTREYYAWRDSISRRLIAEHGFNFIAVEGDWASLYELNRYVKDLPGAATSAREVLQGLTRWPLWMWGNEEVISLAEWLRAFNQELPAHEKVGFYGKDVYDEWNSYEKLLSFLRDHNRGIYRQVQQQYACFEPYAGDSWQYAQMVARGAADCTQEANAVVDLLMQERSSFADISEYDYFWALQNALVVKHAEKFYRKSITRRDASSWNSRVNYMNLTVNRLLEYYGPDSKGIVWAHNTHIGDARFTTMSQQGQENIGHLARVEHGPENVMLVGFATYKGTVKAGAQWGERMQKMEVPAAPAGSIEKIFEQTGLENFYLVFDDDDRTHDAFMQPRGNRAIGVVYNPQNDRHQYVRTTVPLRYDALLFFRETEALTPIHR